MTIVTCLKCGAKNRVDANQIDKVARCGKCHTELDVPSSAAKNKPVTVTDATFERDILQAPGVVLLDCWAPWCGPCRMIGPIMEELASESNGRYRIAKLNVDDNPRVAAQFQIQSIPTMLLFKNGQLVDRLIGAQPKQAIAARLANAT